MKRRLPNPPPRRFAGSQFIVEPLVAVVAATMMVVMVACGSTDSTDGESAAADPEGAAPAPAGAAGPMPSIRGDCSSEGALGGRSDVLFCEPWERSDWWRQGYLMSASTTLPIRASAGDVGRTAVVNEGCLSGSCLKVEMRKWESGALAVHWPMSAAGKAPENVYLRYYLKLAPDFSPELCAPGGAKDSSGGKFPGLADVDAFPDSQCGNGGEVADGINCWSMRTKFRNCSVGEIMPMHVCDSKVTTRFGGYLYYPRSSQDFGNWDTIAWGAGFTNGPCATDPDSVGNCGIGNGGQFENDRWYQIEMQVKMNTPGTADGEIRGWVDGKLSYEKTNMVWRYPGHKILHVRTVWLNIHAGGEFVGLCETSHVYLDQMVVATDAPIGAFGGR